MCLYNVLCRDSEIDFADGKTQCILLHFPIIQSSLSFTDDSVAKYLIFYCVHCVHSEFRHERRGGCGPEPPVPGARGVHRQCDRLQPPLRAVRIRQVHPQPFQVTTVLF